MLQPVGKRLIINPRVDEKKVVEVKTKTIFIPNQEPTQFTVIAIGDEVTKVVPGNIIYLEEHYGIEIEHEGKNYLVIDESNILAKIV